MNSEAQNLCKAIMNTCDTDVSRSSCELEDGDYGATLDASCFATSDMKTRAVQTARIKKLRNKTTTTDVRLVPTIEKKVEDDKAHVCDIHAIITLNVVARNPELTVPGSTVTASEVREITNKPSLVKGKVSKRSSKCTCTDDREQKGGCAESCNYSCKFGGVGPCNAFSLGTADYRMLLREKCNTMLVGGCRVPVCRNFKNYD